MHNKLEIPLTKMPVSLLHKYTEKTSLFLALWKRMQIAQRTFSLLHLALPNRMNANSVARVVLG